MLAPKECDNILKMDSLLVKQQLGQFFTPPQVVDFIYKMLEKIGGGFHSPKIIDPACGEGIFLKHAYDHLITKQSNLYGCDIDPKIDERWRELGIKGKFAHLYHQDGLLDSEYIGSGSFDIAVGNPPYGGQGLKELTELLEGQNEVNNKRASQIKLLKTLLSRYEIWLLGKERPEDEWDTLDENGFDFGFEFGEEDYQAQRKLLIEKFKLAQEKFKKFPVKNFEREIRRLSTFPIEILFLERFIDLVKPGGYVAIILPDGIFSNSQFEGVREWLAQSITINAIVSLPRETFEGTGTNAKTCVLFLTKEKPRAAHKVFLAVVEQAGRESAEMAEILSEFKRFCASEP